MTSKSCMTQAPKSQASPLMRTRIKCNCTAWSQWSENLFCREKVLKLPTTADNLNVGPKFPHFVVPFFCWRFSFVVRLLSWFSKISQTCITVCRDVPPSQKVALAGLFKMQNVTHLEFFCGGKYSLDCCGVVGAVAKVGKVGCSWPWRWASLKKYWLLLDVINYHKKWISDKTET